MHLGQVQVQPVGYLYGIKKASCQCSWADSACLRGAEHPSGFAITPVYPLKQPKFLFILLPLQPSPCCLSPAGAHGEFGGFDVLAQTVYLCSFLPSCLQTFFLHIVSAQPGTPGFKQTTEGMENHHVSLQQLKHNKEQSLGGQARHSHSACSVEEGMLSRKKK